jgi:hypothetical protein
MGEYNSYLGDSVYVELEAGMVKLMTHNGYKNDPRNVIYLEQRTLADFLSWLDRLKIINDEQEQDRMDQESAQEGYPDCL